MKNVIVKNGDNRLNSAEYAVANTPRGSFLGRVDSYGVASYIGIRFGEAGRWEAGTIPEKFDGVMEALHYGDAPWQNPSDFAPCLLDQGMSEDCLNLNVFTNSRISSGKPVMVWFYGGAQITGCNRGCIGFDYDGTNMVRENPDIVLVVPNYRVGFFGTANLSVLDGYSEKYKYSNNLTRLDVLLCLKWVKENISAFGGDPENVTVFGQSAGSNNITALMLMGYAEGYFKKAILQESFAANNSLTTLDDSKTISRELFRKLGASTVEEALGIPAERVLKAQAEILMGLRTGAPEFRFIKSLAMSPVIDNVLLFDDYWENLLSGKNCSGIGVILGSNEGSFDQQFADFSSPDKWGACWNRVVSMVRKWIPEETAECFRNDYPERDLFTAAKDLRNDADMRVGAYEYANALSKNVNTYFYHITYNDRPETSCRARHGVEIPVIFDNGCTANPDFKRAVQQAWLNFARTGCPDNEYLPVKWEKYSPKTNRTLVIDYDFRLVDGIRQKNIDELICYTKEYRIPEFADICGQNRRQEG